MTVWPQHVGPRGGRRRRQPGTRGGDVVDRVDRVIRVLTRPGPTAVDASDECLAGLGRAQIGQFQWTCAFAGDEAAEPVAAGDEDQGAGVPGSSGRT